MKIPKLNKLFDIHVCVQVGKVLQSFYCWKWVGNWIIIKGLGILACYIGEWFEMVVVFW